MKKIFAALLISVGCYSISFAIYVRSHHRELHGKVLAATPQSQIRNNLSKNLGWNHPEALTIVCAIVATMAFTSGAYLLIPDKATKRKSKHRSSRQIKAQKSAVERL